MGGIFCGMPFERLAQVQHFHANELAAILVRLLPKLHVGDGFGPLPELIERLGLGPFHQPPIQGHLDGGQDVFVRNGLELLFGGVPLFFVLVGRSGNDLLKILDRGLDAGRSDGGRGRLDGWLAAFCRLRVGLLLRRRKRG